MGFLEDLKATAGQVIKKVGETVDDIKEKAGLEYQIHNVRKEIREVEESSRVAHEAMGKRVYELFKQGAITDRQLLNGCEEVESLAKKIEELNARALKMRDDFERQQQEEAARRQTEGGASAAPGAGAGAGAPGGADAGAGADASSGRAPGGGSGPSA
jgi:hypothetical protein